MSVRIDAQEGYTSTSAAPGSAFTLIWWGRIAVDRNTYSTYVSVDSGSTSGVLAVQTDTDGVTPYIWDEPGAVYTSISTLTVGTWYKFALTRNGTAQQLYYAVEGGSTSSATQTSTSFTATTLRLGMSPTSGEWLNGNLANVKLYSAVLTQTEIETEWSYWPAQRTSGLVRHHKFRTAAETTDYSGNGYTLTTVGSPTFESTNPTITGDSVSGTVSAPLGGLTAAVTGVHTAAGTVSAPLGGLTASVTGVGAPPPNPITVALGGITASVVGVRSAVGTASAPLGGITASATGYKGTFGAVSASLDGLTVSLLGAGSVYPSIHVYPGQNLYPYAEPYGAAFLTDTLSRTARLVVEIAFGADLTVDPNTWTWTDVTSDVRVSGSGQISIAHGRSDEASKTQPAKMSCTLDNRSGRYSIGTASARYPYVRRNVPVRVRVNLGENITDGLYPGGCPGLYPSVGVIDPLAATFRTIFQGYADGFSPKWDVTGQDATVALSASGALRRLGQGQSPLPSPSRRSIPRQAKVIAYWPCEDGPASTVVTSGLPGGTPMTVTGPAPTWAKSDKVPFSDPVLQIHNATLTGQVPPYSDTGEFQVRAYVYMEDEGTWSTTSGALLTVHTTGTVSPYKFVVGMSANTGKVKFLGYTAGTTTTVVDSGYGGYLLGQPTVLSMNLRQKDSATIEWEFSRYTSGDHFYYPTTGTVAGTLGQVTRVVVNERPTGDINLTGIGHIAVRSAWEQGQFIRNYGAQSAEVVTARLQRLCDENSIPLTIIGTSDVQMGEQRAGTLLDLLRECETADQGVLVDGLHAGLTYICRSARVSATAPALTADVPSSQLARELIPVDDDQRTRNRWEVTRSKGGKAAVEDVHGLLGSATIGLYDSSLTVNTASDTRVVDYAGWLVHLGTVPGYRWPRVALDLAHSPELAAQWATVKPGSWLRVTRANTTRTQLSDATVDLLVEGYTQTLNQFRWDVEINTSSHDPWAVAVYADTVGDTHESVLRAGTDGSLLVSSVDPTDTSMTALTVSGPLWTTSADDYPLELDVGGHKVTATACTVESSRQQTFTITAPGWTLPGGSVVQLWRPRVPSL